MIVLHLQEVGRIPFAQRRMITQQSHSLTLIEFRGMNLKMMVRSKEADGSD